MLQPRLLALLERAADHEARGDRGLRGREAREKVGGEGGHLEAAIGLAERLADLGEIEEGTHDSRLDSPAGVQRNSFFHQPSRRRTDVAAGCGKNRRCFFFRLFFVPSPTYDASEGSE